MAAYSNQTESRQASDRREQILQATIDLLLENGLAATRTRSVTERSGVGTGLLNHYFRWHDLRALAWKLIFDEVARESFPKHNPPDQVIEAYFASAFVPEAAPIWRLWLEATEIAKQDAAIAQVLAQAQANMDEGLSNALAAGNAAKLWSLPNCQATATRLGALYDGLAGLLHSGSRHLTREEATTHLRQLFQMECRE